MSAHPYAYVRGCPTFVSEGTAAESNQPGEAEATSLAIPVPAYRGSKSRPTTYASSLFSAFSLSQFPMPRTMPNQRSAWTSSRSTSVATSTTAKESKDIVFTLVEVPDSEGGKKWQFPPTPKLPFRPFASLKRTNTVETNKRFPVTPNAFQLDLEAQVERDSTGQDQKRLPGELKNIFLQPTFSKARSLREDSRNRQQMFGQILLYGLPGVALFVFIIFIIHKYTTQRN